MERAETGQEEDPEIVQEYAERAAELVAPNVLQSVRQLSGDRLLNGLALEEKLTKKRHVVAARSETPEGDVLPHCDGLPFAPRRGQNIPFVSNVSHDDYNAQLFKRDVLEYGSKTSAEDAWVEERPNADSQNFFKQNDYRGTIPQGTVEKWTLPVAVTVLARVAKGVKAVCNVLQRCGRSSGRSNTSYGVHQ